MMEEDYRPFEAVNIGLATVETGKERFSKDGIQNLPPLSSWRCNLTALSQRSNLYFVATRDTIAVYRPDFPFQNLHRLPALLIIPVLANADAEGYIDERVPHAINHLIVGDLGKEEILLLSMDSGNVTAYYTKAIEDAIRKEPYRLSTDARSDHVGLRPFFAQHVNESAWGLSIHTNARMIAVSANTPHHVPNGDPCAKVTVFAFALTDDSIDSGAEDETDEDEIYLDDGPGEQDWEEWVAMGIDATPPARDRNYKITLAGVEGHDHNIPCISFVNTADDPDGSWLLSTDIGGELKIWQIWQGICQKSWDFTEKRMRSNFFRRREGGWMVAALDPQGFRIARTMDEFCGHSKAPQYHGHSNLESYDLSNVVRLRTPGNSHAHPLMQESTEEDNASEDSKDTSDSWSNVDEATVDLDQAQNDLIVFEDVDSPAKGDFETSFGPRTGTEHRATTDVGTGAPGSSSSTAPEASIISGRDILSLEDMYFEDADDDLASDEDDDAASVSASEMQLDDDDRSSLSRRSTTSLSSLAMPRSPEIDIDVLSASDMDSPMRRRPQVGKELHAPAVVSNDSSVIRANGAARAPNVPTLHCSSSNLRLLMAPQADSPHLFCANVLKQVLPPVIEASNHVHLDRLNMVVQIVELGIVVIATQLGRCAVCSLTKYEKTGTLGLRVDWILPTKQQELTGLRPYGPLLGIAASPVQGHFPTQPSAEPEVDGGGRWGEDGIVDGIPTTFDQTVLTVEEPDMNDIGQDTFGCGTKRKRYSRHFSKLQHHKTRTETRKWELPSAPEPWQAMDSSRRYRLMLTYLDMTVLTYELSRNLEKEDIFHEEIISALELLD